MEQYLVPGSNAKDLLAFYMRTLPAGGWRIDTTTSDPEGKHPGSGGARSLDVCMAPAVWRSVVFGDEASGTVLFVTALPDTDPCR